MMTNYQVCKCENPCKITIYNEKGDVLNRLSTGKFGIDRILGDMTKKYPKGQATHFNCEDLKTCADPEKKVKCGCRIVFYGIKKDGKKEDEFLLYDKESTDKKFSINELKEKTLEGIPFKDYDTWQMNVLCLILD